MIVFLRHNVLGLFQLVQGTVDYTHYVFALGIEIRARFEGFTHFFDHGECLLVDFVQDNGGVQAFPLGSGLQDIDQYG